MPRDTNPMLETMKLLSHSLL